MGLLDFRKKKTKAAEQAELEAARLAEEESTLLDEFLEKDPYVADKQQGKTPSGLYPHEILLLDNAPSFYTDQTDFPKTWRIDLGILDMPRSLASLVDRGFLTEASIDVTLGGQTVGSLKDALRKSSLPVGGKKQELIERLRTALTEADLYILFPKRHYSLTWEGIRALDEAMYISYIGRFPIDGLTIWDMHRLVVENPETSYRDLIWNHFETLSAKYHTTQNFGAYRNLRYRMYQFLMEEKKLKRAFPLLAEVMYYDLSGVESTSDPLHRYVSEKYFFPYDKSLVRLSAGNVQAMRKLQADLNLTDEMLKALLMQFFSQFQVPAHLFTREECFVIILLELHNDTERLRQLYEMAEKRFSEQL